MNQGLQAASLVIISGNLMLLTGVDLCGDRVYSRAGSCYCCSLQFLSTSFFPVPMSCAQGALINLSDLHGDQDRNQLYGHMILQEKNDIKGSCPPESCGSTAELQAGKSGLWISYDMLGSV